MSAFAEARGAILPFCRTAKSRAERHVAPGLATAAPTLAALRPAHALTPRVQSTLVTHAARVRASPATNVLSHCNTRLHVKSKDGMLASLAIGSASAGALLAHLARTRAANALATSAARAAHASLTRCACHAPPPLSRVQRDDDNERDEDERHDEEEREHDARCERVRVRSRLRLSRAKAHAHARC